MMAVDIQRHGTLCVHYAIALPGTFRCLSIVMIIPVPVLVHPHCTAAAGSRGCTPFTVHWILHCGFVRAQSHHVNTLWSVWS